METLLRWVFWACLGLTLVGWWKKDEFVPYAVLPPEVAAEPLQTALSQPGFEVSYDGVAYDVEPKYDYALTGLVVSYRYHDGDRMLHRLWNDHLNVADVCVVWGSNASDLNLNAFDFYNGQFTCNVATRSSEQWRRFSMSGLSNNHLVTDDDYLRDRITELKIGDLIRVTGWLSWYGQAGQGEGTMRKTSTTRSDTGNGACETIYVRDFEVIGRMPNRWRPVGAVAASGLALSGALWVFGVGTGRLSSRRRRR